MPHSNSGKKDWYHKPVSKLDVLILFCIFIVVLSPFIFREHNARFSALEKRVKQQEREIAELRQFKAGVDMVLDFEDFGDCCAVSHRLDFMSGGGIFKYWEESGKK